MPANAKLKDVERPCTSRPILAVRDSDNLQLTAIKDSDSVADKRPRMVVSMLRECCGTGEYYIDLVKD
eukprot:3560097-Pyramimonas_sp.AAC.1